jgi:hypothetical protein
MCVGAWVGGCVRDGAHLSFDAGCRSTGHATHAHHMETRGRQWCTDESVGASHSRDLDGSRERYHQLVVRWWREKDEGRGACRTWSELVVWVAVKVCVCLISVVA